MGATVQPLMNISGHRSATASVDVELGNAWRVRASHALADTLQGLDGVVSAEIVFG